MSRLVITNSTLTDPADKTEVETNFSDVATWANGNVSSDNISELDVDKLTGQFYNHMVLLPEMDLTATGHNTVHIPFGTWTIVAAYWTCRDIGTSTATVKIEEGSWTAVNTWTATKATTTMTIDAIDGTFTAGTFTGSTTGVPGTAYRVQVVGSDGDAQELFCTVVLKRKIHT